ncbi:hypothetical protein [Haloarcula litorea]|uniref:hypothetical protein n=1 Tax=Haloarcula litorea TaxID=3032579 RepID=UPI0023E7E34B|nr:hypothetical protein [Halomicroarcula sp. GDY20]
MNEIEANHAVWADRRTSTLYVVRWGRQTEEVRIRVAAAVVTSARSLSAGFSIVDDSARTTGPAPDPECPVQQAYDGSTGTRSGIHVSERTDHGAMRDAEDSLPDRPLSATEVTTLEAEHGEYGVAPVGFPRKSASCSVHGHRRRLDGRRREAVPRVVSLELQNLEVCQPVTW